MPLKESTKPQSNMNEKENKPKRFCRSFLPTSRGYYWMNLSGISLGAHCLLASYNMLFFVQSSLYSKDGLGTIALSVDYSSQLVTCFFLPPFLIKTIGSKWSLVGSGICICIFVAANLHGTFATLIPAAVCLGIGFATMWATMNIVVSDLAKGYAKITGTSDAVCLSRFFSIFYAVINSASIWGNALSSQILSPQTTTTETNSSATALCGAQFCSQESTQNSSHTSEVPQSEINNLVITGLSTAAVGIILIITFLSTYKPKVQESAETSLSRLLATLRLHRNPNLLLLICCTISSGVMFSFFTADFTKAFVTCSIGINNVGLVTTCFGVALVLGTALLYIATFIPRPALFLSATILNVVALVLMLMWTPDPDDRALFYVIAGLWGTTFSVWMSQLIAFFGDVFPDNHQEAYSAHRMWNCVGFVIGFAWSHFLCMDTKIYIMLGFLLIGTIGYLVVEIHLTRTRTLKTDQSNHEMQAQCQISVIETSLKA